MGVELSPARVVAMVLAGGEGKRLFPLTSERSKPAVPFGGKYRIVDFVLSNLVNSGIYSIYVLIQFRSQSLLQHLSDGWQLGYVCGTHGSWDLYVIEITPKGPRGLEHVLTIGNSALVRGWAWAGDDLVVSQVSNIANLWTLDRDEDGSLDEWTLRCRRP